MLFGYQSSVMYDVVEDLLPSVCFYFVLLSVYFALWKLFRFRRSHHYVCVGNTLLHLCRLIMLAVWSLQLWF